MPITISFIVPGKPATAGSKRAYPIRKKGGGLGVAVTHDCERTKSWMDLVRYHCEKAILANNKLARSVFPVADPITLRIAYHIQRPASHYIGNRKTGKLRPTAPTHHLQKPDRGKLDRCIEDALTGVLYVDDNQVVALTSFKGWLDEHEMSPGSYVTIAVEIEKWINT